MAATIVATRGLEGNGHLYKREGNQLEHTNQVSSGEERACLKVWQVGRNPGREERNDQQEVGHNAMAIIYCIMKPHTLGAEYQNNRLKTFILKFKMPVVKKGTNCAGVPPRTPKYSLYPHAS